MKKVNIEKFVKNYKFQVAICALSAIMAILAAIVGYAAGSETTRTALRIYFVINPAVVIAAVPIETLAVVSPMLMNDRAPKTFFESATLTSGIMTALCVIFIVNSERKELVMGTVTLPYCVAITVAMAIGVAACAVTEKRANKKTTA